jgi:cellulose synthase (UDP-forming)
MWSYLAGIPMVVYFIAPVVFLCFGILPVTSSGVDYAVHLLPFLVLSQLFFAATAKGLTTWRALQYNLALFPVWITALTSAIANVVFGRPLAFSVTDKTGERTRSTWRLLLPQITAATLLLAAAVIGIVRVMLGLGDPFGTVVNLVWVGFDLVVLSVLVGAVRYSNGNNKGVVR